MGNYLQKCSRSQAKRLGFGLTEYLNQKRNPSQFNLIIDRLSKVKSASILILEVRVENVP